MMKAVLISLFMFCTMQVIAQGVPDTTQNNADPKVYNFQTLWKAIRIKAIEEGARLTVSDKSDASGGTFELVDTTKGFHPDGGVIISVPGTKWAIARDMSQSGGTVDLRWFGTHPGDSTFNSTPALTLAQNYCTARGSGLIIISGKYWIDSFVLKGNISYRGSSVSGGILIARPRTVTGRPYGFITLAKGAVVNANLTDIQFWAASNFANPATNPTQWGAYLQAQFDDANTQGGYWTSVWNNVFIMGFDSGLWSRAGYSAHHSLLPNQHLDFNKIDIEVQGGIGARFTGQHGQITFRGGKIKGLRNTVDMRALIDVEATYDPRPYEVAKEGVHGETTADVAGNFIAARTPTNITFENGFNAANSENAYYFRGSQYNTRNGWVENSALAYRIEGLNTQVMIEGQRISNAADSAQYIDIGDSIATTTGSVLSWGGTDCIVTWGGGNNLAGTVNAFLTLEGTTSINSMGILRINAPLTRTATIAGWFPNSNPAQVNIDSTGKLDIKAKDVIFTLASAARPTAELDSITSWTSPSNTVTIRPLSNVTVGTTGNISTYNSIPITFMAGSPIVLQRVIGTAPQFMLTSKPDNRASAVPVDSQYYAAGTIIWNKSNSLFQPTGWIVTTSGYAVSDSAATAYGTTPRAVFRTTSLVLNGVSASTQTFTAFNSTNPSNVLGWTDNTVTGNHQLTIPDADTTKSGFINTAGQYFSGIKVFQSSPRITTLTNALTTDSVLTYKTNDRSIGKASFVATSPIVITRAAGSFTWSLDTTTNHTEAYYNTKYLQNITGKVTAGTNVTITGIGTSGSPYVVSAASGASAPVYATLTGDVTTTSATAGDITGLTVGGSASTVYRITAVLYIGCNNTGGVKFSITGPSGASIMAATATGSSTAVNGNQITRLNSTLGSLTGTAFLRVSATTGAVVIQGYIKTSSTSGNFTLQFASANAGETSTIYSGSTMDLTPLSAGL
jgi:hypothetical protein